MALGPGIIVSFAQSKVSQPLIDVAEEHNTEERFRVTLPGPGSSLTFSFPDISYCWLCKPGRTSFLTFLLLQ